MSDRQESRIGRPVQFGGVIVACHRQPREPRVLQDPLDPEAGTAQRPFRRRNQSVDRFRIESEEVGVPRPPVDVTSNDTCRDRRPEQRLQRRVARDEPSHLWLNVAHHAGEPPR